MFQTIQNSPEFTQEKVQPSFYAIIPAHVRYCKELEPNAKLLYGEITALASSYGYCWATNQYFADLYGVDIRSIKNWIHALQELGFIKCETEINGIQRQRKIWVTPEIQKMFAKGKNFHHVGKNFSPRGTPSPYIHNNTHSSSLPKKEEEEKGAMPPEPPHPPDKKNLIERAPHIFTSQEEHEKLIAIYGEFTTQEAYQLFSDWKIDTSKSKWKKNDYRSMLRWVFKALKERKLKEEELCLKSQMLSEKKEKKNWKKESETSKPKILEKDSEGRVLPKLRSPLLKDLKSSSSDGSKPEKTS